MKKILLTPLFSLFCVLVLHADPDPIKWGKIDKEDLEMTIYPHDSGAAAVVLADYGKVVFDYHGSNGIQIQFERHVRIKILKKTGLDYGNIEVPLYRKGESLGSSVKGVTYNLENGKVEESKLDRKQVFTEEMNDYYDIVKFTMPNVKEGSVLEYRYTVMSDYLFNLVTWEFQRDIPVRWSEFRTEIPDFLYYKTLMGGYLAPTINNSSSKLDINRENVNTNQWAFANVPALKEEKYVTTMSDYVAKIEFELQTIQIPGQIVRHISHTWEKLNKDLNEDENFGKQIGRGNYLTDIVKQVTAGATSPEEKAFMITRYVRENMKYNGRQRVTVSGRLKKVLDEKEGNSADINLLLVSMLQEAGLEANPVVLSTRGHGRLNKFTPLLQDLNYVIAHVRFKDHELLLDGTDPVLPLDMLPFHCLNQEGRLISPDYTTFVRLQNNEKFKESGSGTFKINEDGSLVGELKHVGNGYVAKETRESISRDGEDKYLESLKTTHPDWDIRDYKNKNLKKVNSDLEEVFDLELSSGAVNAGDKIYLQPMITGAEKESPFKLEKREYPVNFGCPVEEMFVFKFEVPEGYVVEEMPEQVVYALPGQAGIFRYSVSEMGNVVNVLSMLKVDKPIFLGSEYPYIKQFYDLIVAKHAEQVVLKKVN